jgi:hypothetical protein
MAGLIRACSGVAEFYYRPAGEELPPCNTGSTESGIGAEAGGG